MSESDFLYGKLQRRRNHTQTIFHAAPEVDRRSLRKIFRWARHFANSKFEVRALSQHFIVEYKIVGIFEQRQRRQHITAKRTIAGVVFRQLDSQKQVLESRSEGGLRRIYRKAFRRAKPVLR